MLSFGYVHLKLFLSMQSFTQRGRQKLGYEGMLVG